MSTSLNNYKLLHFAFAFDPEHSVKHLQLWLNLWRPTSHGGEHESKLAWLWAGKDKAGDKGSWLLPDAGELEAAMLPWIRPPNPLWPGLLIPNTSALSYFESAQASKNTRHAPSILTLAQAPPWERGTSLFAPCKELALHTTSLPPYDSVTVFTCSRNRANYC